MASSSYGAFFFFFFASIEGSYPDACTAWFSIANLKNQYTCYHKNWTLTACFHGLDLRYLEVHSPWQRLRQGNLHLLFQDVFL